MPKAEDLLLPDSAIPDISGAEDFDFEEPVEEEEETNEALEGMIAELLSYPIVTVEDLVAGLDEDEFQEKYQKFKNRAIQTGFAKNLARYMEESGMDWLNDPRIAVAVSGIMYFLFVAVDFKQTLDRKKKKKALEEVSEGEIVVEQSEGGELE